MARQPRVEYAGALHHVMSRGNDGIAIFRDADDRMLFLDLLAQWGKMGTCPQKSGKMGTCLQMSLARRAFYPS